jgi:hypothetical protein
VRIAACTRQRGHGGGGAGDGSSSASSLRRPAAINKARAGRIDTPKEQATCRLETVRQIDRQTPKTLLVFVFFKKTYGVFVCTFWGLFLTAANNTTTTPDGRRTGSVLPSPCADCGRSNCSTCRTLPPPGAYSLPLSLAPCHSKTHRRGLPAFSKRPRSRSRSLHAEAHDHEGIQCIEILFV